MSTEDKEWQIHCHQCNMLKSDKGAIKVGTEQKWYWRCEDCTKKLEEALGDLGIL